MSKDLPPILRFLRDNLKYRVRDKVTPVLGYDRFYVDLSSWRLRLADTHAVWVRSSAVENRSPEHIVDSLHDVIRELKLRREQPLIVLFDGESKPLRERATKTLERRRMVIVGAEEQEEVLHSQRPSGYLRDLVLEQVPISALAPYETATPVIGGRFFGREHELYRVLRNLDTNYFILGIRRIGKTSLLREIERQLKEEDEGEEDTSYIVYLDCSDLQRPDDYIQEVVRKLNPTELPRLAMQNYAFFFPNFLERMYRRYKRKLIFLLDEIDNLILLERGRWELFKMLRASSNKQFCQYIIAGFREAMKEQYRQEAPFFNFAQDIRLNEFTHQQARDLILIPMENLGVRFRSGSEVVGRIYEETAGHPNLIQYYCSVLLRRLDETNEREISPDSLINVYQDEGFKSYLLTTFMQNTKNREKALVYALLMKKDRDLSGYTQKAIDAILRRNGIELSQGDIDETCEVLKLAGILRQKRAEYFFTSPVFTKVLQQAYSLEYLLKKAKEEGL
jgi:hypothetical protein